jgi:putative membrane protein
MTGDGRVFDPGLQPERTALAWRRTGLAVAVGAIAGTRLLVPTLGAGAVVLGLLGLALAVLLLLGSTRRARRAQACLLRDGNLVSGPGGRLIAAVCIACTSVGVAALAVVLGAHL